MIDAATCPAWGFSSDGERLSEMDVVAWFDMLKSRHEMPEEMASIERLKYEFIYVKTR